jgi:tetratricopeptide (TPR) repeat protein
LSLKLGASARAAKPIDPEAYRLYLEGRHFWSLRDLDALDRAEVAFGQALRIDPESALIHAGLAELYGTRAIYRGMAVRPEAGDLNRASEQADRAIALDPKLTQGYVARATMFLARGDVVQAERLLRESLAPNDALAFNRLGDALLAAGRLDAALENYQHALQLDPLSLFIGRDVVRQLVYARRFQDAIEAATRFEATAVPDIRISGNRAHALVQTGKKEEAAAVLKPFMTKFAPKEFSGLMAEWVLYLREANLEAESEALAEQLLARFGPDTYVYGWVLMARGRTEEALPLLKAFPPGTKDRLYWSPIFDPVREDPRFLRKVEELGVAAEYKVARATLARMLKEQAGKK